MANRTAWTAGNGVGYTWTSIFNTSDLASMASGNAVLSTIADITNQSAQDIFMDISTIIGVSSAATYSAGANIVYWLYPLLADGATYGDGQLTAGTQATKTPGLPIAAIVNISTTTTTSLAIGFNQQITIPPGSFRLAAQNNTGLTLASSTVTPSVVKYRTYNLNLNN